MTNQPTKKRYQNWLTGAQQTTCLGTVERPSSLSWILGDCRCAASDSWIHTSQRTSPWQYKPTQRWKRYSGCCFSLSTLKMTTLPQEMLVTFYNCCIESILTEHFKVVLQLLLSGQRVTSARHVQWTKVNPGLPYCSRSTPSGAPLRRSESVRTLHIHAITCLNCCHQQDIIKLSTARARLVVALRPRNSDK